MKLRITGQNLHELPISLFKLVQQQSFAENTTNFLSPKDDFYFKISMKHAAGLSGQKRMSDAVSPAVFNY